jgi:predicted CXXCH cytochrome family protein
LQVLVVFLSTPNPPKRTKQRASRIALDYYKRGDNMLRWKRLLALLAAVMAMGWLAAGLLRHDEIASPGELAWAHASGERDCAACHVNFSPIRGDALLAGTGGTSNAADQRCKVCHGDVVDHHPIQVLQETACASCHTEHRGRDAVLTRTADRACTQCHADLDRHSKDAVHFQKVSHFDPDPEHHPEFKSIAADPGTLKFSHRRHLALGLTFGPLDRSDACRLDEKFPPSFRQQYEGFVKENQLLKLDCSACHQLGARDGASTSSGASGPGAASPRSTGEYMRPVNYETHCQACHPLNFRPPSDQSCKPDSSEDIPHRLKPDQICQFVERAYSALVLQDDSSLLDKVVSPPRSLPSKPATQDELTRRLEFEEGMNLASSHLHAVCSKCHQLAEANRWPQVDPVNVPELWLQHARFNHAAHQATKRVCRDCHANESLNDQPPGWTKDLQAAGPIDGAGTLDNGEILIPGIRTCLECHAPSATQDDRPRGGARTDCVECHWYHPDRDARGASAAGSEAMHGLRGRSRDRKATVDAAALRLRAANGDESR